MRRSSTPRAWGVVVAISAATCSSCLSYTERTAGALREFERGRFEEARERFGDSDVVESAFLRGAETGMIALSAGEWDIAQRRLDKAAEEVRELEERALIGPEQLAESLTALLVNEAAASYSGEGYERVQLHAALAMTYLARGSYDGVYVETRRANGLLETEEKLYEKKYRAGGLGHFMSALAFELEQRYDEAYIDYKRMVEKDVGVELAGKALVRIATRMRFVDELPHWEERFGEAGAIPRDAANIVVIAGVGLGPFKVEHTLALPGQHGLIQISAPEFRARPQMVSALDLAVDGGAPLRTSVIEDVASVARDNLADRMAWLALRTVARAAIKYEGTRVLAKSLGNEHGAGAEVAGLIAGVLFTAATERADTRSWLTLPDTWQAARLFVAPGEHELVLTAVGGESVRLGRFRLVAGETMIVLARTLGPNLHAHPIGGVRVDAPLPPPTPTTPPTTVQS